MTGSGFETAEAFYFLLTLRWALFSLERFNA
jgi:hypothetical protein